MTISFGDLMYTDLYDWQGQYGTLDWHQILQFYDCTAELGYYLNNKPTPPVEPPPYVPPYNPPPYEPPPPVVCLIGCDGTPPIIPVQPVPEISTWAMLILGFAALALAYRRRLA